MASVHCPHRKRIPSREALHWVYQVRDFAAGVPKASPTAATSAASSPPTNTGADLTVTLSPGRTDVSRPTYAVRQEQSQPSAAGEDFKM
jgi:hypothetical protein